MKNSLSLSTAFSLLIGVFAVYSLSSLGFVFHISINIVFILLAILCMVIIPIKMYEISIKNSLLSLIMITLICIISALCSLKIADVSYDGMWYHKTAILLLKKGWNPIYETAEFFFYQYWNVRTTSLIWVENYPKFYEIFAANIFYLTNNIEYGKMLNFLSLAILFFYSFYVLGQNLLKDKVCWNVCFSLALVINPIMMAQAYTYYVDGLVYVYFMLMLLALLDMEQSKKEAKIANAIFVMSAVILSNLKLGGLFYAIVILLIYMFYSILYKNKKARINLIKNSIAILVLILLMGINPYITNLTRGRHIFHPVLGAEKIDIISHNQPSQFFNKTMPYKLFMSTFSQVDNIMHIYSDKEIELKVPFTYNKSEEEIIGLYDTRQAAFGIFWSGILLITLVLMLFIKHKKVNNKKIYHLITNVLLLSILLNPENWWGRYVPQFFAFPIFVFIFYLITKNNRIRKIIVGLSLCLVFVNSLWIFEKMYYRNSYLTEHLNNQMQNMELKKREQFMIENLEYSDLREDFTSTVLLFLDKYSRK